MTIDLMTAKEANKIYQNRQKEKAEKIISNIVDNIKEAIAAGAGSADMTFSKYPQETELLTAAINTIKELGYNITVLHRESPFSDYIYRIIVSWENVENG